MTALLTISGMADTKSVGEITEAVVMAEFLKAGFPVLLPFGDNRRYDLVVEVGGTFLRVQCKTASLCGWHGDRSCIRFKARSGAFGPGDRVTGRSRAYRGEVDLFAAYAPTTGQVYVLDVDEVPETDVWLRLTPAKNNQQHGVRLAEHHTLAAWVARGAHPRTVTGGSVAGTTLPPSGTRPERPGG